MSLDIEKALQGITEVYRAGMAGPLTDEQRKIRAIVAAYEKCGGEALQLPTPLLCAIVAARGTC